MDILFFTDFYAWFLQHTIPYLSDENILAYMGGCSDNSPTYNVLRMLTFWPFWPAAIVVVVIGIYLALMAEPTTDAR